MVVGSAAGCAVPSATVPPPSPLAGVQFHGTWSDYSEPERIAVLGRLAAAGEHEGPASVLHQPDPPAGHLPPPGRPATARRAAAGRASPRLIRRPTPSTAGVARVAAVPAGARSGTSTDDIDRRSG